MSGSLFQSGRLRPETFSAGCDSAAHAPGCEPCLPLLYGPSVAVQGHALQVNRTVIGGGPDVHAPAPVLNGPSVSKPVPFSPEGSPVVGPCFSAGRVDQGETRPTLHPSSPSFVQGELVAWLESGGGWVMPHAAQIIQADLERVEIELVDEGAIRLWVPLCECDPWPSR